MTERRRPGRRRTISYRNFDYASDGAYFVTLVAHGRSLIFGSVVDAQSVLSEAGNIVKEEWERSSALRPELTLDTLVIMPNHLHAVVWIASDATVGATGRSPKRELTRRSLGAFIAGFKGQSAARINRLRGTTGRPVWQRNYFDRIVRNERELNAIVAYINSNPSLWAEDEENPDMLRRGDDLLAMFAGLRSSSGALDDTSS